MFTKVDNSHIDNISVECQTLNDIENCVIVFLDDVTAKYYHITRNLSVYYGGKKISNNNLDKDMSDIEVKLFKYYTLALYNFEEIKKHDNADRKKSIVNGSIVLQRKCDACSINWTSGYGYIFGWDKMSHYNNISFDAFATYPMRLYQTFIVPVIKHYNDASNAYVNPSQSILEIRAAMEDKNAKISALSLQNKAVAMQHAADTARLKLQLTVLEEANAEYKRKCEVLSLEAAEYNERLYALTLKDNAHDIVVAEMKQKHDETSALLLSAISKINARDESLAKLIEENKRLQAQVFEQQRAASIGKNSADRIKSLEAENKAMMRKLSEANCKIYDLETLRDEQQTLITQYEMDISGLKFDMAKRAGHKK